MKLLCLLASRELILSRGYLIALAPNTKAEKQIGLSYQASGNWYYELKILYSADIFLHGSYLNFFSSQTEPSQSVEHLKTVYKRLLETMDHIRKIVNQVTNDVIEILLHVYLFDAKKQEKWPGILKYLDYVLVPKVFYKVS